MMSATPSLLDVIEPDWPAPSNVKALTTTVYGGVSVGNKSSLNLGLHVGDNVRHVLENRSRLKSHVGLSVELCWLQQTHSDIIVTVDQYQGVVEADASVSQTVNQACIVMTADCLPVLLSSEDGAHVAALHCGWRGLYQNLIGKTLQSFFADKKVLAWLGPAIYPTSYEVDESLFQRFAQRSSSYKAAFSPSRAGHYWFDLYEVARQQLFDAGLDLNDIYGGGFDTLSDSRFFSHRQTPEAGRMASLIYRI